MNKSKLTAFLVSVVTGIIKATPFGHIQTEIENNLKSDRTNEPGQIDKIRLIVWIITTVLFILKGLNIITFEQIVKILELLTQQN